MNAWPWLTLALAGCAGAATCPSPPPGEAVTGPVPTALEAAPPPTGPEPVVRRRNQRLSFGSYALEVDPTDGGRIVELSLDGRNVLLTREEFPLAYGSSFWPSPQKDWSWPPPIEFDAAAWSERVDGPSLVLESRTSAQLGLAATQRISTDAVRETFVIAHNMTNRGANTRAVAPWQNTRVRPGGLTFFPANAGSVGDSKLLLEPTNGVVWFQHDPAHFAESQKAFVDGEEGWLAQLAGDLLFLKVFPPVPRERAAPSEAEIEIYVDGKGRFVEIEQQGPYQELQPGSSLHWTVYWLVRRVPDGVIAEPGSESLVTWARGLRSRLAP